MLSQLVLQAAATALLQVVCIDLVLLFLAFCCVPKCHQPVRALVRPHVVRHVEAGAAWVVWAQSHERRWLTRVFEQSSHSVSVGFYVSWQRGWGDVGPAGNPAATAAAPPRRRGRAAILSVFFSRCRAPSCRP
jgi:hypothetical protein